MRNALPPALLFTLPCSHRVILHCMKHSLCLHCTLQASFVLLKYKIHRSICFSAEATRAEGGHPWPFKAEPVAFQLCSDRLFLGLYAPFLFIDLPLSDLYNDLLTEEETLGADSCLKNIAVVCSSFPAPQHTPFQTQLSAPQQDTYLQAGILYSPSHELFTLCIGKAQRDLWIPRPNCYMKLFQNLVCFQWGSLQ